MTLLLVSTYELGHQPVHVASPAAALNRAGIDTTCLDLSVDEFDVGVFDDIDAVAFSVPMHTAMRLAIPTAAAIKDARPDLPIAFYGLYADVGREWTLGRVADAIFCGEYEPSLVQWADGGRDRGDQPVVVHLGKSELLVPDRSGLPGLDRYARLERDGRARLAGAVEASHGCRHRCAHCPIPAVYDGRMRVVGNEVVLADIAQLEEMGAEHITFTDADFLNAPAYSMGLLREANSAFPDLSYDITVKVEHVIRHEGLWAEMAKLGVLFTVSAFESVDERTLEILDKGHTVDDMARSVAILREARVHIRPTWLPFLPWTTPADIAGIFSFLDEHRLAPSVDPVQMAIKVLIPEGSLLLARPEMNPHLRHFDPEALTWLWDFESAETERLQKELDRIAAEASDCSEDAHTTLAAMREVVSSISGSDLGAQPAFDAADPRLTESWFCCAEPTVGQATAIGSIVLGRSTDR